MEKLWKTHDEILSPKGGKRLGEILKKKGRNFNRKDE